MINYRLKTILERDCFVNNGGYFATKIRVFEDGTVDCWGRKDKATFLKEANSGWITVDIPDGAELRICNQDFIVKVNETLYSHDRPKDGIKKGDLMFKHKWITQEEFIREILDAIHTAQGNKSASELCYEAYQDCVELATADNLRVLIDRYLDVPKHNRGYILGNQDLKDYPIRDMIEYAGKVMAVSGIEMEKIRKQI